MAPIGEPETLHTFKNHLHLTLSYCDLLLDELPSENPMRRDIAEIQAAVRRALAMVPELLATSAPPEPVPVKERT